MDLKGYDHVYKCAPKLWFDPEGVVTVELKCAPKKDIDAQARLTTTYGPEETGRSGHEFIDRYVKNIEGLSVEGEPVTTFDKLRELGPDDLYTWIYVTVMSQERLTKAEIKNS